MIDTTKLRELAQNIANHMRSEHRTEYPRDAMAEYIDAAHPFVILQVLDELDAAKRMFLAACADLGAINAALDLDHDDAGADPILYEVKRMQHIEAAARNLAKVKGRHHSGAGHESATGGVEMSEPEKELLENLYEESPAIAELRIKIEQVELSNPPNRNSQMRMLSLQIWEEKFAIQKRVKCQQK